ncbi:DUF6090 family protein [Robiginitalea sp. IMCC43444]|uniref:DUF6090 family protein n=1 Tax=Robiginitalea sp. IMCC43444 TaxID=3459121 RepID=UPI0040423136
MLTFLRKIRQNLLSEGKTATYVKYALGEIVLVVIGILIALQINNWNEYSKERREEQEILASLKDEINSNIAILKASIKENKQHGANTIKVVDSINNHFTTLSVLSLVNCFNYATPQLNTFVLEDILSSDTKLKTKDEAFVSSLRKLTAQHLNVKKTEFFLDEYWNSKSTDFIIKTGLSFSNLTVTNKRISLLDIERGGYTKIQAVSLLYLYDDLRGAWIRSQTKTLEVAEQVIQSLDDSK